MKVLIKNTDSAHSKHRIGQIRELRFIDDVAIFEYVDGSNKRAITTPIKSIIIQTQNTKYELEAK